MIVGKFPPRNQQNGNRGGSFKGRGGNQGRRNYQARDEQPEDDTEQDHGENDQDNEQETANSDTRQSGRRTSGRTQENTIGVRGGRTQTAQKSASHSDEGSGYSEEPGW